MKNVNLKQKNSAGTYKQLYPIATSDKTYLSDTLKAQYEIEDGNADEAIEALMQFVSVFNTVRLTVLSSRGTPVAGASVTGFTSETTTNENGVATGIVDDSGVLAVESPYTDLKSTEVQVTSSNSAPYTEKTATLEQYTSDEPIVCESSKNVKFSDGVQSVDVECVGSGSNETTKQDNIAVDSDVDYPVLIGANGGSSSCLGVTANGASDNDKNGLVTIHINSDSEATK